MNYFLLLPVASLDYVLLLGRSPMNASWARLRSSGRRPACSRDCGDPPPGDRLRHLLGVFARAAVRDRRPRVLALQHVHNTLRLRAAAPLPSTVTTSHAMFGRSNPRAHRRPTPATPSLRRGLRRHPRGRRRRRRRRRRATERRDRAVQAQVVGSEVVAPLRHAVRLVHHEQPHLCRVP